VRIGAHISVSGGYPKAVDYAQSVGCECIQVFAKSPRQWKGPPIDPNSAETFRELRAEHDISPLFTHTAYLINLATDDSLLRERSIEALADELARGSTIGADGVVTHIGADPSGDPLAAARRVGGAITEAFDRAGAPDCDTRLLLENTAGAGRTFGATFEEIAAAMAAADVPLDRLGVCLDTCHAFAWGYALHVADGWQDVLEDIDETVGIGRLGLIHANDCKFERGTRRDRHEWIGDGFIGVEGFSAMVGAPALQSTPVVTEMPGELPTKDEVNIARLKALREVCVASQDSA
jgi:deoxyribonuclease-4